MIEDHVTANNVKLWTACQGSGRPVVLAHGGPGACDYLEPLANLIDDEATVYRYEQRGCGRSEDKPPCDIITTAKDLDALRINFGHESWIVCGHSWGSCVAISYALEFPERVDALILLSGTGISIDWMKEYHRNNASTPPEMEPVFAYPSNTDLQRITWMEWKKYVTKPGIKERARNLEMPILIINGALDPRPSWAAKEFADMTPNSEFHLLENVEHYLWMSETTPLQKLLREFISQIR